MPKKPATSPPEPTPSGESSLSSTPTEVTASALSRRDALPDPSADDTNDAFDGLVNLRRGPVILYPNKTRITIHIDTDTIAAFRERVQGTSRGYQTAINDALREYLAAETLETTLRRVLRDELARTEVSPTTD